MALELIRFEPELAYYIFADILALYYVEITIIMVFHNFIVKF